jgi:tRNA(Ile)-lysidine synthase
VSAADTAAPVSSAEAKTLFGPLAHLPVLVLAVSGGPDSTALLMLAARWRAARKAGPKLLAVTVDHGLRQESAGEARAVKRLARRLGVPHRTLRWPGDKPLTGLQEAAREARYRLLAAFAKSAKAHHILTAHTLDDQAETVLIRMTRGSGVTGLAGMAPMSPLPVGCDIMLVRPLLEMPKARLVATLARAKIDFADDASNSDPRFTRARLRALMPGLAREGLDARRLVLLARRLRRADAAIDAAVDAAATGAAAASPSECRWPDRGAIVLDAEKFGRLPAEVALRLLGRAITQAGEERAIRLGKLETLYEALASAKAAANGPGFRLRRTLGGALVTLAAGRLTVERAPPRSVEIGGSNLTTAKYGRRGGPKRR